MPQSFNFVRQNIEISFPLYKKEVNYFQGAPICSSLWENAYRGDLIARLSGSFALYNNSSGK